MNQAAVDAIRNAGGKNSIRYIMCPALRASAHDALSNAFVLPNDGAKRIIAAVHTYTPNDFAMAPLVKQGSPMLAKRNCKGCLPVWKKSSLVRE